MTDTNGSGPGGFDARDEYDILEIRRALEGGSPPRLIGSSDVDQAAADAVLAGVIGAAEERDLIAGLLAEVTQTSGKHSQPPTLPAFFEGVRRGRQDAPHIALLEQSADASPRPWQTEHTDTCQQPGCHQAAEWFVRFRRRTGRPAYSRLCIRDASRRVRRRALSHSTGSATPRKDNSR